ncbi:MAG: urease accessory protein UreE [Betaproteobacteria bacterium]|nr:MAG: urease accessory protein UreE [Betaproteobacteria bacterium]
MLVISKLLPKQSRCDVELVLPFDLRQKSRLRTTLADGEEVGLFLERGHVLRDGDFLQAEDGRVVVVRARAERVLHIFCDSEPDLVRVVYHLGNRHVPLQVGKGWVRIADDDVLRKMVEGLGASVKVMNAPFEPEAGAYGGHHHHGGEESGSVIHQFGRAAKQSRAKAL